MSPDDPRYGRPAGPPPVIYADRPPGQQPYPYSDRADPNAPRPPEGYEHCREHEVEMFFHGQGPEVTGVPVQWQWTMVQVFQQHRVVAPPDSVVS